MRTSISGTLIALAMLAPAAEAVETVVTVRAISRDAKVMGSGVGGARITIRDAKSGKVLAEGIQMGGTGDTKAIMRDPHARGADVYSVGNAGSFVATIDLAEPTWVDIVAEGALGFPQSMARASKSMLLVPGKHIVGDGVILELHGFNIEVLEPHADVFAGEPVPVRARLTMT